MVVNDLGESPSARYRQATAAARSDAVEQLSGVMAATHAELLALIAAVVAAGDWADDGATSPAAWVVAMCRITAEHAAEWVRVARALEDLPALRAGYASGLVSWDQLRPATVFATADTDEAVLAEIIGLSARQVAAMARDRRPITRPDAQDVEAHQSVTFRPDRRRGGVRISGLLPTDVAATIAASLDRRSEAMGPNPLTGRWDPAPKRRAIALHDLATADLAAAGRADATTVVIHAEAAVIDGTVAGNGTIGDAAVARDGVLQALCDARVEVAVHGPFGATVGVGRATRNPPWWLRRTIEGRDRHCRFPGCDRQIRQIHHIEHWTRGGPTDATNLVGLCWAHHRLVHHGGWTIDGNPDHTIAFRDPTHTRQITSRPTPLHPTIQQRLFGPDG